MSRTNSYRIYLLSLFLVLSLTGKSQLNKAETFFELENYSYALSNYQLELAKDSANIYVNYQIAQCYLRMNTDRTLARPFLLKVIEINPDKYFPKIFYELGLTHFHSNNFLEAIRTFEYYKQYIPIEQHTQADLMIDYCFNAEELIEKPLDVTFVNLGPNINSDSDDFNPYVTIDEKRMLYSSKSDKRSAKVFMSSRVGYESEWEKCRRAGSKINATSDQIVSGLSPDGSTLFLYFNNYDVTNNDIVISNYDGSVFEDTKVMTGQVNTNKGEEGACITLYKDTLFFASSRPGGFGGLDIYMSKRLPNGSWAAPLNLGSKINTPADDNYPSISTNGQTLYFSSKGHNSMGGYDIFQSTWDPIRNTWDKAENIGYPINDTYNNNNISILGNKRYAYVAAIRPEGLGELDIYKVIFNKAEPDYFVYQGNVQLENPTIPDSYLPISKVEQDLKISVFDLIEGDYFGVYTCNKESGKYVLALPPGKYELEIISPLDNYLDLLYPIEITEGYNKGAQVKKDLTLKLKK